MIRALICDLDNTLYSPWDVPREVLQPIFDAVLAANRGPDPVDPELLARAVEEGRGRPFSHVVAEYGLPSWCLDVWARENARLEVREPLPPFDDVACLWDLPVRRFLVTSGFRRFQESKVRALDLGHHFEAVLIDVVDETPRKGKEALFRGILVETGFAPHEVVVLGDSAVAEIAAGNRLGMVTVQVLRDGVAPADDADFRIRGCDELPSILRALDDQS